MAYYRHKKGNYYRKHNYYTREPKDCAPLTPEDKLRLLSDSIPKTPPQKPSLKGYQLSQKWFERYEMHPNLASRHRRYDIGCSPLIITWGVLGVVCWVFSHQDYKLANTVFFSCFGLGFLAMFVYGFFREFYNKVVAYDNYKSALERYESEYEKYSERIKQKEDLERSIKENERALKSFVNGLEGKQFLQSAAQSLKVFDVFKHHTEDSWRAMTARAFEFAVADVYSRLGYHASVTRESSDGGVDVVLSKDGRTYYVQCKHYAPTTLVPVHEIREFFGVCMRRHFDGFFVHTSSLTPDAQEFASDVEVKKHIKIVSLYELMSLEKNGGSALLELNTKSSTSLSFLQEVINNPDYKDCRYFWLYNRLFDSINSASQAMREQRVWDDMQYAIVSETPDTLQSPVFMIVLGSKEAIRQLSRKKLVSEMYPEH